MLFDAETIIEVEIDNKGKIIQSNLFENNIVDYISPICKGDTLSRLEKPINLDTFFTIIDYENVEYPVNATIYCDTCIKVIFSSLVGGKKNCINYIGFLQYNLKNSTIISLDINGRYERINESIEIFTKPNKYNMMIYPEHAISFVDFMRNKLDINEHYFQMYIETDLRWVSFCNIGNPKGLDNIYYIGIMDITRFIDEQMPIIKKSFRDSLTNTLPKESIYQYINDYLNVYNDSTSMVILLDVDYFKQVNDNYGHSFGDKVLIRIVECIKMHIEQFPGYQIGRYGGDEFLIFVPNISYYFDVKEICSKIRKEVVKIYYDEIKSFSVSVTMGVTRFPEDGNTIDVLIKKADKALYRGKMKGRDCYVIYDEEKCGNIDPNREVIDLKELSKDIKQKYSLVDMISDITFDMLNSSDVNVGINNALEKIATLMSLDRIIFRYKGYEFFYGIDKYPLSEEYTNLAIEKFKDYFSNNHLNASNSNKLQWKNLDLRDMLVRFNVKAFDMYRFADEDDNLLGYLSFEMCEEKRPYVQSEINAFSIFKSYLKNIVDKKLK